MSIPSTAQLQNLDGDLNEGAKSLASLTHMVRTLGHAWSKERDEGIEGKASAAVATLLGTGACASAWLVSSSDQSDYFSSAKESNYVGLCVAAGKVLIGSSLAVKASSWICRTALEMTTDDEGARMIRIADYADEIARVVLDATSTDLEDPLKVESRLGEANELIELLESEVSMGAIFPSVYQLMIAHNKFISVATDKIDNCYPKPV